MALNKKQKEAIDNYSSSIKTIDTFVSAVRKLPGMYLGELGSAGWISCIREIAQNSIDQLIMQESPANYFKLQVNLVTKEVTTIDNGLGLPIDSMMRILTSQHTSKNFTKQKGQYSSGRHGVGAKVVNALSEYFIADSYNYTGQAARLEMHYGVPTTEEPVPIENPECKQGTIIRFKVDEGILFEGQRATLNIEALRQLCHFMFYQTPIGSRMIFEVITESGEVLSEDLVNDNGILTGLHEIVGSPMVNPIVIFKDDGERRIQVAFTYDVNMLESGNTSLGNIVGYSNLCPTVSGTHIEGFIKGVQSWFVKYMNNVYLANDKRSKTKVVPNDVLCSLSAVLFAAHLEPNFTGQQKQIISNEDFIPFVKTAVMEGLDEWSKQNPGDLQKIAKFVKEMADVRMRSEKEKVKIATKYNRNVLTGLPSKYARPGGNKNLEFIIVEGDSAAGTAKVARDVYRQGIFPIRGKLPNAMKKSRQEIFSNEEIQGMNAILLDGKDYTPNFDPYIDCKYEKIIIMADADIDGGHIADLAIAYFLVYMPQLIEAGKVYKAVPPLYGEVIGTRKGSDGQTHPKYRYFTDRLDVIKYVQSDFIKKNAITVNGKELKGAELTAFFGQNEEYLYHLKTIATRNYVDPKMLELYLVNKFINNGTMKELDSILKKHWRFVEITHNDQYNADMISIVTEGKNTLYANETLDNDCVDIIKILEGNSSFNLTLNGQQATLYDIMDEYDRSKPPKLQRFKGLGEMDADSLGESTLLPDNRVLIQYTIEDLKYEFETIKRYNANSKELLKRMGVVRRSELLGL